MKIDTVKAPIEISASSGVAHQFTIAMNAKAFKVLSDSLYQNKIGSIVREVSCNALDAHIMADKADLPFVIHLPDSFEPWFSVQDFGVGISPNAMFTVFCKYFESTKDDSNNQIGAFGLGAKSPMAYTDQFTVTSITDGMKRMYSVFVAETGLPSIIEMDVSDTDEGNGVEIRMSAKREDFSKFASETATQLRFFKVKPTVLNAASSFAFKAISQDLAIDSEHVAICNTGAGYGDAWAHIIQGNVGYPLDVSQLNDKISKENAALLQALNGAQVRFYFNIGDIGVTASREGVEYNKHTIANIDAKLTASRVILTDYITQQLTGFETDYDKALFLNSSESIGRLARGADITLANVKYNHNKYYFDFSSVFLHKTKKNGYGSPLTVGIVKRWSQGRSSRESAHANLTPTQNANVQFVLRDTNNRPNMRAKHLLETNGGSLMEITMHDESDGFTDEFIQELTTAIGGYNKIVKLSEVVLPVSLGVDGQKVRTNNYTRPTYYAFKTGTSQWIRQWERMFDDLDEMEDDYAYVVIDDMLVKEGRDIAAIAAYSTYKGIDNAAHRLIGIRESDLKKIAGMTNYIPLQQYIVDVKNGHADNTKMKIAFKRLKAGEAVFDIVNRSLFDQDLLEALNLDAPDAPATRLLTFAASRYRDNVDGKRLQALGTFMGWPDTLSAKSIKCLNKCWDEIKIRYPLLEAYNDWSVRGKIAPSHIAKYLNVM